MKFRFDINKSIAATAFVIQKAGGRYNTLHIVKTLYHANRKFLIQYGRTITGDRLVSMTMGPVVSDMYDLLKGSSAASSSNLIKWKTVISDREGNNVRITGSPDLTYLSKAEIETLKESFDIVSKVKGKISDWSHKEFPEWKDPRGGSEDIDPIEILKLENKNEDEISCIEQELGTVNWLKSIAS